MDWCLPNRHCDMRLRIPFRGIYKAILRVARILCAQSGDMYSHRVNEDVVVNVVGI